MKNVVAGIISYLGCSTRRFFGTVGDVFFFFIDILKWTFYKPFIRKVYELRDVVVQAEIVGVKSLFIVGLVSVLTGMILAFQIAHVLKDYGQEWIVPGIVARILARELGPLMTAVVIIGRIGAAFTAEIGTMKTHEELLALDAMAINPVGRLVAPRFLAMLIMMPALTTIALLIGIGGGFFVGVTMYDIVPYDYMNVTMKGLETTDLVAGFIKSFVFGAIITVISCYMGFWVEGGPEGVGRSTRESVVTSIVLVIIADLLVTSVLITYS